MKFRNISIALVFLSSLSIFSQNEVYELRTYELNLLKPNGIVHNYLEGALIPALNRQGIVNVGAFEETGDALPKKVYLLIAYPDMVAYQVVSDNLKKDNQFKLDSESYSNTPPDVFPYHRVKTSFIRSVSGFPKLVKPLDGSSLFELRIYESYNEDALRRKVKMFNDSEFTIFDEIGLHTVFFGENISGDQMPCLTYLLGFQDMKERDDNWEKFGPHPEWQRIVKLEEYANTVSNIIRIYLKPLSYSQL